MNTVEYFQSITSELDALKNRVRNFIEDEHWLTDGEWKESVLRTILHRHLPKTFDVGRGFVVSRNNVSDQIDILIYDTSKPVLYRDRDLVFITPDAARGVIEVKTKVNSSNFKEALNKLANNAFDINKDSNVPNNRIFFAFFSYESELNNDYVYVQEKLIEAVKSDFNRLISYLCLGKSGFVRFWDTFIIEGTEREHNKWHAYNLENMAPGYFINNVIAHICPESVDKNIDLWFPRYPGGKELNCIREIPFFKEEGKC